MQNKRDNPPFCDERQRLDIRSEWYLGQWHLRVSYGAAEERGNVQEAALFKQVVWIEHSSPDLFHVVLHSIPSSAESIY
jgi:hypothetical protein